MLTSAPLIKNNIIQSLKHAVPLSLLLILASCASTGAKNTQENTAPSSATTTTVPITTNISDQDREKFNAGLGAMNNNDLSTAEKIFSEIIDNQPSLAGPYCNMGLIHLKRGDYQKSIDFVTKGITLNSKIAQAFNIRAQALVATGKIKEAEKDYIKAIAIDKRYAIAHYNLALLYDIYYQELNKAIKHYEIYTSLLEQPDKPTIEWIKHLKGSL